MKLIVFDWDGTLADSTVNIAQAIEQSCRDLDLPVPEREQSLYPIGLGIRESLQCVAPTLPDWRYPEMLAAFRKKFISTENTIALFPGVREMLSALNAKGALLGVATGKSRNGLNRALASLSLGEHFAVSRCADEGLPKPHPEMLLHVMYTCGVNPEQTIMVGDTTHDLLLAANAGVKAIACNYGAHTAEALLAHNPVALSSNVQELQKTLTQWLEHE